MNIESQKEGIDDMIIYIHTYICIIVQEGGVCKDPYGTVEGSRIFSDGCWTVFMECLVNNIVNLISNLKTKKRQLKTNLKTGRKYFKSYIKYRGLPKIIKEPLKLT